MYIYMGANKVARRGSARGGAGQVGRAAEQRHRKKELICIITLEGGGGWVVVHFVVSQCRGVD